MRDEKKFSNRPLTKPETLVLIYLHTYFEANDQLPSYQAIADFFGWSSPNAANQVLFSLNKKRFVERNDANKWRFVAGDRKSLNDIVFKPNSIQQTNE